MKFDKEQYWKNRKNKETIDGEEVEAPIRGQGKESKPKFRPNKNVEIGFTNGGRTVVKNRAYRRKPIRLKSKANNEKRK